MRVGGAGGPSTEDQSRPAPLSDKPGGRAASPGDEQPAADMPETAPDDDGVAVQENAP